MLTLVWLFGALFVFSPLMGMKKAIEGAHHGALIEVIGMIAEGRGDRLKDMACPELFSGRVWSGEQALPLGLIDGLGNASSVARDVIAEKELLDFTVQESPLDRFWKKLGANGAERLAIWMGFHALRCVDPPLRLCSDYIR